MLVSDLQRIINSIPKELLKRIDIRKGYIDLYSEETNTAKQVDFCFDTLEFETKVRQAIKEITPSIMLYRDTREILKTLNDYVLHNNYYFNITGSLNNYYIEIHRDYDDYLVLKYMLSNGEATSINTLFKGINKPLFSKLLNHIQD